MQVSPNIVRALNRLVQSEYRASLNYLQISTWFEVENFPGIASHFKAESASEREHALLVIDHMTEMGLKPQIPHEFDKDLPSPVCKNFDKYHEYFQFSHDAELSLLNQMGMDFYYRGNC